MEFTEVEKDVLEKYHFQFLDEARSGLKFVLTKENFDFIDKKLQSEGVSFVFHFVDAVCNVDYEVYYNIIDKIMKLEPIVTLENGSTILDIISTHSTLKNIILVESFVPRSSESVNNTNPIHGAAVGGNYEVLEFFLKKRDYDANAFSYDENATPIELAFQEGHYDCVFLLANHISYDWKTDPFSFVTTAQENQDEVFLSHFHNNVSPRKNLAFLPL
jgi:hypothetical protein